MRRAVWTRESRDVQRPATALFTNSISWFVRFVKLCDSAETRAIKIEPKNMTCDLWSRLLALLCFLEYYFIDLWARAKRMITGELNKSVPTCAPVLYRFTRCFCRLFFCWKTDGYLACERLRPARVLPIAQTRICPKSLPSKQSFVLTVTFFVVDHLFGLSFEKTLPIIYLLAFPACLQTSTNSLSCFRL